MKTSVSTKTFSLPYEAGLRCVKSIASTSKGLEAMMLAIGVLVGRYGPFATIQRSHSDRYFLT